MDVSQVPTGTAPNGCVAGFDLGAGKLTLALSSDVSVLLLGVVSGEIQANGVTCTAADGTKATTANTVAITVNGSALDETMILDLATGPFGASLLAPGGGIHVNLAGGTDAFLLRGSGSDSASSKYVRLLRTW